MMSRPFYNANYDSSKDISSVALIGIDNSLSMHNNVDAQNFHIMIAASKDKIATVKNSTGKILEYRVSLNTNIIIKDFLTNDEILNQYFTYSSSYKVQDQHFETRQLENKTIENLINKTSQDLKIKLSEKISTK